MAFHGRREGTMKIGVHMTPQLIPWVVLKQLPEVANFLSMQCIELDVTYRFEVRPLWSAVSIWVFTDAFVTPPVLPWSTR